jgi:UDP-N-acetylenolpyruvoylglucosamine reductase
MGPLAIFLRGEGWEVAGWDDAPAQPMSDFLRDAGVVFANDFVFDAARPPALVAHSSAVKEGHPLRERAAAAGARLIRRGELLAERVAAGGRHFIAVCGSHGKTTTCGMLAQALPAAGVDAGYVLGGVYRDPLLPPAKVGASPWVVAEVDESDGTISRFSPEITLAVNLDWDHPDYYRTERDLEEVFAALFRRTTGAIFIPENSDRLRRLAAGEGVTAQVFAVPVTAAGDDGVPDFNEQNAALALAVTRFVAGGVGEPPLGEFSGIRRRQDTLFAAPHLRILADYAHHPTEIGALLRHLSQTPRSPLSAPRSRLIAVFQPHRHTRTRQYAREFAEVLKLADEVLLLPVYSAGESPVAGGTTSSVFDAAGGDPRFRLVAGEAELRAALSPRSPLPAPDAPTTTTIAFIGAGDIDRMAARFANDCRWDALRRNAPFGARTTLGVGGTAAFYAEPEGVDELRSLVADARRRGVRVFVMGKGANLVVPDAGFDGLLIRLVKPFWRRVRIRPDTAAQPPRSPTRITAGGGAELAAIARAAADAGLDGFTFLDGIPGTLGGALRMNAGANGAAIFERVAEVVWLAPDGTLRRDPRERFDARYRECPTLAGTAGDAAGGGIVIAATLVAAGTAAPDALHAAARAAKERRRATQPLEFRSAGSVFKNPAGDSAGRLIEQCGLKGLRRGGAVVSEKHANFIVIADPAVASAGDYLALTEEVRRTVREKTGVSLELEVAVVGG